MWEENRHKQTPFHSLHLSFLIELLLVFVQFILCCTAEQSFAFHAVIANSLRCCVKRFSVLASQCRLCLSETKQTTHKHQTQIRCRRIWNHAKLPGQEKVKGWKLHCNDTAHFLPISSDLIRLAMAFRIASFFSSSDGAAGSAGASGWRRALRAARAEAGRAGWSEAADRSCFSLSLLFISISLSRCCFRKLTRFLYSSSLIPAMLAWVKPHNWQSKCQGTATPTGQRQSKPECGGVCVCVCVCVCSKRGVGKQLDKCLILINTKTRRQTENGQQQRWRHGLHCLPHSYGAKMPQDTAGLKKKERLSELNNAKHAQPFSESSLFKQRTGKHLIHYQMMTGVKCDLLSLHIDTLPNDDRNKMWST